MSQSAIPTTVHPRSPLGAMFLSLLIPGAGSMYAGQVGWGLAILGAWIIALIMLVTVAMPAIVLVILGLAVFSPVHGFRSARAWNTARGIES